MLLGNVTLAGNLDGIVAVLSDGKIFPNYIDFFFFEGESFE